MLQIFIILVLIFIYKILYYFFKCLNHQFSYVETFQLHDWKHIFDSICNKMRAFFPTFANAAIKQLIVP